ncbi:hypothetical protein BDB00DRAFT_834989 [Zychaea mexicana]|uniref:uncharacterized protein n=1 Tax=Zychaea mexicana TaxID=64656 RepID=UPI0022FE116C|nr:uncharacterized protein BDB00DRAFT_834989 [Zychaea mexicana]KAI9491050.1 hypothetical protein BDB00DRAFT_834989 [Zychaea mexicana]
MGDMAMPLSCTFILSMMLTVVTAGFDFRLFAATFFLTRSRSLPHLATLVALGVFVSLFSASKVLRCLASSYVVLPVYHLYLAQFPS